MRQFAMYAMQSRGESGVFQKIYIIAGRIIICGPALPRNGRGWSDKKALSAKFIDQRVEAQNVSIRKEGVKVQ